MPRQGKIPVASALALTVAAGVALAQEHLWTPAAGRPIITAASSHGRGVVALTKAQTVQAGTAGKPASSDQAAQPNNGSDGQGRSSGVGSRGLTGNDEERHAGDQPEMATGVDLKGPPVRFPVVDTPE